MMMLEGRLGIAPVESPANVLDIGTGTGIWAIEYGKSPAPGTRDFPGGLTMIKVESAEEQEGAVDGDKMEVDD